MKMLPILKVYKATINSGPQWSNHHTFLKVALVLYLEHKPLNLYNNKTFSDTGLQFFYFIIPVCDKSKLALHNKLLRNQIKDLRKITTMTLLDSTNEIKLDNPPTDCIQSVKFGKNSNQFLLSASWDCTVRLYDVFSNKLCSKYDHSAPVLDCAFQDSNKVWSGGFDKNVRVFDIAKGNEDIIGSHSAPIRCVEYSADNNLTITGGWDGNVKAWDGRSPHVIGIYPQPDKIYSLDICGDLLVIGTAGRRVLVWDLRNMCYAQQRRESSLKFQTRCIRCFSNKEGFVLSSIEGRVAVEFLDTDPIVQKKKYAFKCHRSKTESSSGLEQIYPVNAISFHSGYNTFATGGSDGFVNIWDGFNKKRLCQFHKYPTSISSLCFSPDGSHLAIASSYLYESSDIKDVPADAIFIRKVSDQEAKPK